MDYCNNDNNSNLYIDISLKNNSSVIDKLKTPRLYETWTWEGDQTVLPSKWVDLIKQSGLNICADKSYLKEKYYGSENFDKKLFFFITHRSETAGCVYCTKYSENVDKSDSNLYKYQFKLEYLIVNNKHITKGVENGLIGLCVKKIIEDLSNDSGSDSEEFIRFYIDKSTSNIEKSKLIELGFK